MKKLLTFVLALSMVASTCLYAQAVKKNKPKTDEKVGETDTLLFYGCTVWPISSIYFIQTDTSLPPSFYQNNQYGNYYYGEAISGSFYKCTFAEIYIANTTYFNEYGLGIPNGFDFVLPKEKDKIVYLGIKNRDGTIADGTIYDDIFYAKNKSPEEKTKSLKKGELKLRIKAIKAMRTKYKGTKWDPILKEELEKVENLQKKLKKGEDLGDEE